MSFYPLMVANRYKDAPKLTLAGRRADRSAFYLLGLLTQDNQDLCNKTKLIERKC